MDDPNAPATKADIETLRSATKADIETLGSGTKADIELLRSEMKGNIEVLRSEMKGNIEVLRSEMKDDSEMLRSEMAHGYRDIVERIADSQTELLKAFYGYAQGNNKRVAELEGNEGAFRSRLATIEDRILEVERRLNIPPAN
jgi:hypothetical protein